MYTYISAYMKNEYHSILVGGEVARTWVLLDSLSINFSGRHLL